MEHQEVGVYKPHPKVYQLAVDRLSPPASEIAFQSSNSWEAHAAARSACKSSGAIDMASGGSGFPERSTAR
jgi:hypothetical protein